MADYFFNDGPGIGAVIMALADAFYEAAINQQRDERAARPRKRTTLARHEPRWS